ncbi:MAG TPA: amidohydrolase, partial [Planctomycetaceae bacterium]|nr:amidohydrolase [Planctomycetaceae bacterium]
LDDARPTASAVAITSDRIVAVGTDAEIAPFIGPDTKVIECNGRFVMPGFIEGHGHFVSLGESKRQLDLSTATSWDDVVAKVAKAAAMTPKGTWIVGRGWHQGKWKEPPREQVEGYPDTRAMSQAVPEHPVLLTHGTGHMVLVNELAMALAGITNETKPPRGGEILRAADGRAIGVFRETAMSPLYRALERDQADRTPEEVRAELLACIDAATQECLRFGVTTFHDAGAPLSEVDVFRDLAAVGKLPVRLWVMLNDGDDVLADNLAQYRTVGSHLTVRGIKRMIDGALGTHGAWLLEPYDDLPTSRGLNMQSLDAIRRTAELAVQHDYQLCVHAIGDLANRETLSLMESVFRAHPEKRDLRWRIEHAQHIHPVDIPRFKQLGVIASMQGNHATSDGPFVIQRLGDWRARTGAYAWRSLLDAGAVVINGTDAPVETLNPVDSFYASVTRRMASGEPFIPEQAMTRAEALRSYTRAAAWAGFEEDAKGTLSVGKLADIVVLSDDLLNVPADQLRSTRVDVTIIGGKVVYERR